MPPCVPSQGGGIEKAGHPFPRGDFELGNPLQWRGPRSGGGLNLYRADANIQGLELGVLQNSKGRNFFDVLGQLRD